MTQKQKDTHRKPKLLQTFLGAEMMDMFLTVDICVPFIMCTVLLLHGLTHAAYIITCYEQINKTILYNVSE